MANIQPLINKILKWEGGFSNHPDDRGGPTNKGITLATWQEVGYDKDGDGDIDRNDLTLLSRQDVIAILRQYYWNRWRADEIHSQAVAEILVDWVWCSGKWGIVIPQRILDVYADGVVGNITISAVNHATPYDLHLQLFESRIHFIQRIIQHDPTQKCFEKGWLNRLNDFTYHETLQP